MFRRLVPVLIAAIAVAAGSCSPAPAHSIQPIQPSQTTQPGKAYGAPPVLSIYAHGPSKLGPDGRLFIRTDEPGSLDIVGVAPAGHSDTDAGTFSLVASKSAVGWDAVPLVSPGPTFRSEWHWQAGASSLAVALSYRSPDGSTSPTAVQTIVAVSDPPSVHIEQITGQPNATTADLTWTETDGIGPGIAEREVLREVAPATTQGCGEWTKGDADRISARDVEPADSTSAVSEKWLALADLQLGHCYRFTLSVTDALGLAGLATTPIYVPGLLDGQGRPLPPWTGKFDIFRASAFVSQERSTWCVGAATQMMINLISGASDQSSEAQATYLKYARDKDLLPDSNSGAGLVGWQEALNKFSGTRYEVETIGSLQDAMNLAALRLRLTNRPVGLAVQGTLHAWVMTGFEATADPAFDPSFTVTAVYVSGPLYPREEENGYDPAPDTRLTVSDLGLYFTPVSWKAQLTWEFVAPVV